MARAGPPPPKYCLTYLHVARFACSEVRVRDTSNADPHCFGFLPPARPPTCPPACLLPAYVPTCLLAFLPFLASLPNRLLAYLPTCLLAYLLTCLPAYLPACLPVGLFSAARTYAFRTACADKLNSNLRTRVNTYVKQTSQLPDL